MTESIYLPAHESSYKQLSQFSDLSGLNEAVKAHRDAHRLTQTERDVLDVLSRYSVKYKGVCYLSKSNIAKAIGRVRRTIIRACKRLEALGIIVQYETKRVTGDLRQSSNIVVIQAIDGLVTAESHTVDTPTKAIKPSNTYKETPISADTVIKRGLKESIPSAIYTALEPFFSGQQLYDTYGVLLRAKAAIDRSITIEDHADRYVDAFYNVIRLYKAGKVRKLSGLLYVSWEGLSAEISRQISVA